MMDNDATLMPENDALAVEYQGDYRGARRNCDIANVQHEAGVQGLTGRHSSSFLVELADLLRGQAAPVRDDARDPSLIS